MPNLISRRVRRKLLTGSLLVAMTFRVLIPTGFMPSSERPFSLEICHGGTVSPSGHGSDGAAGHHPLPDRPHYEHCPFGAAPAPGPVASVPGFLPAAPVVERSMRPDASLRLISRLQRAQSARAPPFAV